MSTHAQGSNNWLDEKKCPTCGKGFPVLHPNMWRFKAENRKNHKIDYYCRYSCFMEAEKEKDEMRKLTLEHKKKAIQIAVDGGNPFDFLEECGIHNVAEVWSKIKQNCKEMDPDTYKKLPKRLPQRERKTEAPKVEKIVLVEDPSIAEEYRAEQAAKQKASGPVRYDGLDITAVRHPELGEFYYDKKFNSIDWRTEGGDEVSMGPVFWKRLLVELPRIMTILGVEL